MNQRNNLLKQIGFDSALKDTLDIWDMQMVNYGRKVIETRRLFIAQLNEWLEQIHGRLTGNREKLRLVYQRVRSRRISSVYCYQKEIRISG